jgi:leader peptidase (prepilin peptidase) / N-methyltransferase
VDVRTDSDLLMTETTASVVSPQPSAPEGEGGFVARPRRPLREILPRGARAVSVAAVSAALVVVAFVQFGVTTWAFIGLVLCPAMVLLTAIDLEHRLLPNVIVLPAALAVLAIVAVSAPHDLVTHVTAGVALGGFFFASAALIPGSIGMGDAKLGLLIGLALGSQTFRAVEIALLCVLAVALWIVFTQGAEARKKAIAFGPFLALGAVLGFFLA